MSLRVLSNDTIVWYRQYKYPRYDYRKHDMPYYIWIGHRVLSKKFLIVMGNDAVHDIQSIIYTNKNDCYFFRNGARMLIIKKN